MIFPDVPRRRTPWTDRAQLMPRPVQAPLHSVEEPKGPSKITVEEWWIQHGLATDPAALPKRSPGEKIDWWAKDAVEFYALCVVMLAWCVYWLGVHRGAW